METQIPNISWFPIFFPLFCTIYLVGYFIVFKHWGPKHRSEASSCFISLLHGTPAVFLSIAAILSNPIRGLASPNSPFQNLVLDFSISYFAVDLLYLALVTKQALFIAHHLATLFVFATCRYVVLHGAFSILVLLALAEVTSFCQNVWTLAGLKRSEWERAAHVYKVLSPPFYGLYTLARVILGPWFFYEMSCFYLSGEDGGVIPMWIAISWIVVVGGAISVSILWISNLWMVLYRETIGSSDKRKVQ